MVGLLEMSGIVQTFPGVKALDDASLSVRAGEVHGLVGENGAGKSTIIKVLAGVYRRDAGTIRIAGETIDSPTPKAIRAAGIHFVHQELHLVPHFTVAEAVFMGQERAGVLGVKRREMESRAAEVLGTQLGAELNPRTLVRDIRPADRKLVQIARALVNESPRLIVFDEPTAPLAAAEVDWVFAAIEGLKAQGIAVLYVSHYLSEITQLCDRVTVLRNGTDVGVLSDVQPGVEAELIKLMIGRDLGQLFATSDREPGEVLLQAENLSDGKRFSNVSLSVREGEIVGIAGLLGSGREELVDCLFGLRPLAEGLISLRGQPVKPKSPSQLLQLGMALVPRDRRNDGLVLGFDVADNLNLPTPKAVSVRGFISAKQALARAQEFIAKLDIRPNRPDIVTRQLSGGNQQKVVLGRWLAADVDLFVLDEPTVGVDIGAKSEIYRLLAEVASDAKAVLVSSNDPVELLGICDRVLVMLRGEIVAELPAGTSMERLVSITTGSEQSQEVSQ